MLLATALLLTVALFAIVVGIVTAYMRRVVDVAVTDWFRAAETIVDGHIPDKWVAQINRRIAIGDTIRLFKPRVSKPKLALARIDKLYRYFEKSRFVENAEARELLLGKLRETRECWAKMTWNEIVAEYGGGHRPKADDQQQSLTN